MSEPLVVDDADVDVGLHLLAPDARVHRLAAVVVEAGGAQLLAEVIHRLLLLAELEGGRILGVGRFAAPTM